MLPKAGLVVSEKGPLVEVLCKPKILPLKSVTLQKLEELEVRPAWRACAACVGSRHGSHAVAARTGGSACRRLNPCCSRTPQARAAAAAQQQQQQARPGTGLR